MTAALIVTALYVTVAIRLAIGIGRAIHGHAQRDTWVPNTAAEFLELTR